MLYPASKSNMAGDEVLTEATLPKMQLSKATLPALYQHRRSDQASAPNGKADTAKDTAKANSRKGFTNLTKANLAKNRALPKNFFLKRLDTLYWKRLLRYIYIRFLRMRSSPPAIARGVAAGAFAGSFPLLGLQTIAGVAIASCVRGNKVIAAASTWISNPLTYVPLFALNFHIGRVLLRLPPTELPDAAVGLDVWMAMGMDVGAALLLGSLIVGIVMSVVGYYVGLQVAGRVQARKRQRKS